MKNKQKAKAIEIMRQMGIYKPYVDGFEKVDHECVFEIYGGYWVYTEPEV